MKSIYGMVGIGLFVMSFATFAQEVVAPAMPTDEFISLFIESLGGLKGASALAIVILVLKILFAFLNSEIAGKIAFMKNLDPGLKLFIILFISYVSGVLTLMSVSNLSFGAAFIHSTSMSALIVLLNQGYKKFIK